MQVGKQEAKNKINTHNNMFCKKIRLGHVPGGTCHRNMIKKILLTRTEKNKTKSNFYRRESSLSGPKLDTYAES